MPPSANEDAVEEANRTFATVTAKPAAAEKTSEISEVFFILTRNLNFPSKNQFLKRSERAAGG